MSTVAPAPAAERPWKALVARVGVAYLLSRLCVIAGAAIVAAQQVADERTTEGFVRPKNAVGLITEVLTSWDGAWYYRIIRNGYPKVIPPNVTFEMMEARAAFFPVYPVAARWFDRIVPGGDVLAGIFLNLLLGAAAVYVIGVIARDLFGSRVAYRTMLLVTFFPGSFVLSFTYSEAALILLAALCLLMLLREHWLAAGLLAALGTAARPNGLALVAACAIASVVAISDRRAWRSLVAPVLSPLGFVAFQTYLRVRTGEWAWFRVQREAWDEGTSFGLTAIRNSLDAIVHPLSSPTDILTAVSFIVTIILIVLMWKRRLPWPLIAYTAVVIALMLLPSTVTARPRFLFTAFPAFISVAAWWPEEHEEAWDALLAMCGAGLVTLTGLYGVLGAIP